MRSTKQSHTGAILFWLMLDVGIVAFVSMQHMGWPGSSQGTGDEQQFAEFPSDLREEGDLCVGDPAPDFTLKTFDGKSTVTLSSFRDKRPVVLVFGSYTCPMFRNQFGGLDQVRARYRNKAEVLFVYIQEAHPVEGHQLLENKYWGVQVSEPKTLEERARVAATCAAKFRIHTPLLVDTIDNRTQSDYAAWPMRLYLVGEDGKVAYQGSPTPTLFNIGEMTQALDKELEAKTAMLSGDREATPLTSARLTSATSRRNVVGERHALGSPPAPAESDPSAVMKGRQLGV